MSTSPTCHFIIVAAGHGARFGSELPKQYHEIAPGLTVLGLCLQRLQAWAQCGSILVVAHPDYEDRLSTIGCSWVAGGASRQESVRLGLEALQAQSGDYVFIHDAARPLVTSAMLDRLSQGIENHEGAIPALPVADTLKTFELGSPETIKASADRAQFRRVQTPQAFRYSEILAAHQGFGDRSDFTDDASLYEALGKTVALVPGEEQLMKITTASDLLVVKALYQQGY